MFHPLSSCKTHVLHWAQENTLIWWIQQRASYIKEGHSVTFSPWQDILFCTPVVIQSSYDYVLSQRRNARFQHHVRVSTIMPSNVQVPHFLDQDSGRKVNIVDTSGFDDSYAGITDTVILREISEYLFKECVYLLTFNSLQFVLTAIWNAWWWTKVKWFLICSTDIRPSVQRDALAKYGPWPQVDERRWRHTPFPNFIGKPILGGILLALDLFRRILGWYRTFFWSLTGSIYFMRFRIIHAGIHQELHHLPLPPLSSTVFSIFRCKFAWRHSISSPKSMLIVLRGRTSLLLPGVILLSFS